MKLLIGVLVVVMTLSVHVTAHPCKEGQVFEGFMFKHLSNGQVKESAVCRTPEPEPEKPIECPPVEAIPTQCRIPKSCGLREDKKSERLDSTFDHLSDEESLRSISCDIASRCELEEPQSAQSRKLCADAKFICSSLFSEDRKKIHICTNPSEPCDINQHETPRSPDYTQATFSEVSENVFKVCYNDVRQRVALPLAVFERPSIFKITKNDNGGTYTLCINKVPGYSSVVQKASIWEVVDTAIAYNEIAPDVRESEFYYVFWMVILITFIINMFSKSCQCTERANLNQSTNEESESVAPSSTMNEESESSETSSSMNEEKVAKTFKPQSPEYENF
ncbi:MAG: hypothetical protein BVN35_14445 [Proteobacteria bacterium ST_bin11]|nr:MAG: hypothetical protein BVN35_14445 [Proteobacteria bacterium ST_bin11]